MDEYNNIQIQYLPAAVYAYNVGKNTLESQKWQKLIKITTFHNFKTFISVDLPEISLSPEAGRLFTL